MSSKKACIPRSTSRLCYRLTPVAAQLPAQCGSCWLLSLPAQNFSVFKAKTETVCQIRKLLNGLNGTVDPRFVG